MASPRSAGAGSVGVEAIWRKLREAGFSEEAIKSRSKEVLIAYISRLEAEVNPLAWRGVLVSWLVLWFLACLVSPWRVLSGDERRTIS